MDNLAWLIPVGIAVLVLIGLVVWMLVARGRIQKLDQQVDEAWHDIAAQLKRRADLVPSVIAAVQGHGSQAPSSAQPNTERVFALVDTARGETLAARTPSEASVAENHFQGALRGLFGLAQTYPQLHSSPEFVQLQADLVQTEDKLQSARRRYNGSVRELSAAAKKFPGSVVASKEAREREFFEVADRAAIAEPPRVQF